MAKIDRAFVAVGLGWLILGMLLGFYMGAHGDNRFLNVHVAMLMGGFIVLTVYGVLYRLWPAMQATALAKLQFWIAIIGALGVVVGSAQIVLGGGVAIAAIGSALAIIAALLMGWLFLARAA